MYFPPESPDPARSRPSAEHSSFQRFSFPEAPFSPPSGPTQWLLQGPPAESKFLAASGLELFIARMVVEARGFSIDYKSREVIGTKGPNIFRLLIPARLIKSSAVSSSKNAEAPARF